LARGDSVGYGATWTANRETRIAILSAGYADGYMRAAGGPEGRTRADVLIAGPRCPIVGRISMDLTAVDVSALADNAARRGDWATLIGGEIEIDALATQCGTIGYEIMSNLGRRCARVWKQ